MCIDKQEQDAETGKDYSDQSNETLKIICHSFEAFPDQPHFEQLSVLWRDAEDLIPHCAEVLPSYEQLLEANLTWICSDYPIKILCLFLWEERNTAKKIQSRAYLQRMQDPTPN